MTPSLDDVAVMASPTFSIVGIGASAGGLDAFGGFFKAMPADSGLAFVIVLHLPAGRRSMLPEIVGRWTNMAVTEAANGDVIEPNHVYVPPPHSIVTLDDGRIRIRMPLSDSPREYRPIDGFFDSLARVARERAVGIVLSGTGADGSLGLKSIKEGGGLTMAQGSDGSEPQFAEMPASAIAMGVVDLVAGVQDMPRHLMRLSRGPGDAAEPEALSPDELDAVRGEICNILRAAVGHDFSGYKEQTFMRRVRRRMQVVNLASLADYVERLRDDHEEVVFLFRDLLIRVTSFFRDEDAFDTLRAAVIPRLFAGKQADSSVRVWVPGCATGEEAYSLAILLHEHMQTLRAVPRVQVFGTDIDDSAITAARLGLYPSMLLEGLSEARRANFRKTATGYVIRKEIRDLCTFSPHSIVRDPPFSRMDMISCRNLLIYLDAELQDAIIPAFHYALVPRGILLLGISESTSRHGNLFEPLDKAARIFQRRDGPSPPLVLRQGGRPDAPRRQAVLLDRFAGGPSSTTLAAGQSRTPDPVGPRGEPRAKPARGPIATLLRAGSSVIGNTLLNPVSLRRRLQSTRGELQALTEEHEAAVEELRSANEEMQSVNEEMQSTNEELETSKEELQAVNEELHTVNARLSEKVDETDRANSDLRNLFDSTQIATIFLDRHLVVRSFTPAVGTIYNLIPSDHGRPLTDIVSHIRYNDLPQDTRTVLQTLQPLERRVVADDDRTHYVLRILPYRGPDSGVDGTVVTFLDVTSIVQAEQHQRLLVDELNHRVKNMLTVVVSLAVQTLRRSPSLEAFSQAFLGRVNALAASHTLLSDQQWVSVSLRDVIATETAPYAADRRGVVLSGPDIRLSPTGALAIGLAIHELATNAVKYGAFAVAEGMVHADWRVEAGGGGAQMVLVWTERGGPAVVEPLRRGFGMTLIERSFAHELSGEATIEFDPAGLRAILRAPLSAVAYQDATPVVAA